MSEEKGEYNAGEAAEALAMLGKGYLESLSEDAFLEELGNLLQRMPSLSQENAKKAYLLIKDFTKLQQRNRFQTFGRCLSCDTDIQYGNLCQSHTRHGDEWLESFRAKWKIPMIVYGYGRGGLKINGFSEKTVLPYLCKNCTNEVYETLAKNQEKEQQEQRVRLQNGRATTNGIINGTIKVSASKRFSIMSFNMNKTMVETLRDMPYADFLNTYYWDIVRKYKLVKGNYSCELCNTKGTVLNVHHKTYEHRGEEYRYLEDLIVLCSDCHGKFHNKLAE